MYIMYSLNKTNLAPCVTHVTMCQLLYLNQVQYADVCNSQVLKSQRCITHTNRIVPSSNMKLSIVRHLQVGGAEHPKCCMPHAPRWTLKYCTFGSGIMISCYVFHLVIYFKVLLNIATSSK